MLNATKGDTIRIFEAAHPYSCAGITDPSCIIPAETKFITVERVNPKTLSVRAEDGMGYRINRDTTRWPKWRTYEVV